MKWQIRYALENINKNAFSRSKAEYIGGDVIKITTEEQPDVLSIISNAQTITKDSAETYLADNPQIDFICGYRKECVWQGEAITFLQSKNIGWGNFGTLCSAANEGTANSAEHKVYKFAARLIQQYGIVESVNRELDRLVCVTLKSGRQVRVGMLPDYEPTADNIRSFWAEFGAVDIAWNINPNGEPSTTAKEVGDELGCKVLKNEGMKAYLQSL